MSSASETYITIGKACVDKIEETFKHTQRAQDKHANEIVSISNRVEHLCLKLGKTKGGTARTAQVVERLIELNKDLYRGIFEEEPPLIEGHKLHVAITLLERICLLLVQNDCLTLVRRTPSLNM